MATPISEIRASSGGGTCSLPPISEKKSSSGGGTCSLPPTVAYCSPNGTIGGTVKTLPPNMNTLFLPSMELIGHLHSNVGRKVVVSSHGGTHERAMQKQHHSLPPKKFTDRSLSGTIGGSFKTLPPNVTRKYYATA
jgi:hypothetical protein